MLPWRKSSQKDRPQEEKISDLFQYLKREVPRLRPQGEQAVRDSRSFSRYLCDLCSASYAIEDLRQCTVCGRWGCPSCWAPDYYLCASCQGILKLFLMSAEKSRIIQGDVAYEGRNGEEEKKPGSLPPTEG